MRSIVTVAAFTALIAMAPAAAQAATQCKSVVLGAGPSDSSAWNVWRQAVTSQYGAAWADLSLAKNKTTDQVNLALAVEYFVSAVPCRVLRVDSALLNNIGDLEVMQTNEPAAASTPTFKHGKLVKFN